MYGVIQQRDGMAEEPPDDFRGDEAKRGDHGPAEHRWAQNGMRVTVAMMVPVLKLVTMQVFPLGWVAFTGWAISVTAAPLI